jgi:peptidoglycan hydrolase CwlO-like protein
MNYLFGRETNNSPQSRDTLLGKQQSSTTKNNNNSSMSVQEVLDYQRETIKKQDESVEDLIAAVDRIKNVAVETGDEIDRQNKELVELENDVHKVKNRINRETKRVDKLIASNRSWFSLW